MPLDGENAPEGQRDLLGSKDTIKANFGDSEC